MKRKEMGMRGKEREREECMCNYSEKFRIKILEKEDALNTCLFYCMIKQKICKYAAPVTSFYSIRCNSGMDAVIIIHC